MSEQQTTHYNEFTMAKTSFEPIFEFNDVPLPKGGVRHQQPSIVLVGKNRRIVLTGKPFSRFLQFLGVGKYDFMRFMYKSENTTTRSGRKVVKKTFIGTSRANLFLRYASVEASFDKLKFLEIDGQIVRVTSDDYIGIRHSFVQQVIENRLDAEGIKYTKEIKFGGTCGKYSFNNTQNTQVGQEIGHQISYFNRNSGDKSLKMSGGAVVLVCANGMTSLKASSKMRIVHKLTEGDLRRRIEGELGTILEKVKLLPQEFLKLREYNVTKEQARILVDSLKVPKYLQEAIWKRLFTASEKTRNGDMDWDGTMWGIYMASTYIASHADEIKKTTHQVQSVDEDIVEKLSAVELFTDVWDRREKLLNNSNAPKRTIGF